VATIVLVRHATTAATGKRLGGWTDAPLDTRGVAQAKAAARRLADLPIVAVYSSPIVRTLQTARMVAKPHKLRVRKRKGLGEVDYGEWTDAALGNLRRRRYWEVVQRTPSRAEFPGGETIRGMQARAVDAVETIAAHHGDEWVLAISHADVIKAVVAHFVGMPLDAFQRLVVSPGSATVLQLPEDGLPLLKRFNDTGPMAGPEGKR
jgi:probable phosphomutase (TIGR03848 family)